MPNYEAIAADCDIIAQKIKSLGESLSNVKSEKAVKIGEALFRASNAIETAHDEADST